jgi:hypothetical protein
MPSMAGRDTPRRCRAPACHARGERAARSARSRPGAWRGHPQAQPGRGHAAIVRQPLLRAAPYIRQPRAGPMRGVWRQRRSTRRRSSRTSAAAAVSAGAVGAGMGMAMAVRGIAQAGQNILTLGKRCAASRAVDVHGASLWGRRSYLYHCGWQMVERSSVVARIGVG